MKSAILAFRHPAYFLLSAFLFFIPYEARASGTVSESDRQSIQSVIADQISAFRRDDGVAAYQYAAPTIKRMFPDVQIFMNMVKRGYRPVYRPQSYAFGQTRMLEHGPAQEVMIVGPRGKQWIAVYTMAVQPDGQWKITGCFLQEAAGESI